jgi:hypothetical protein
MKSTLLIASGILLAAVAYAAAPAQALSMKECSAKYKEAKAAGTLNGMKWNEFRKSQCGAETEATPAAAPPAEAPAEKPAAKASGGRQAMYARERACGKEWKADKAAGKVPAGMKWPQYWHECDQRKKAEGM